MAVGYTAAFHGSNGQGNSTVQVTVNVASGDDCIVLFVGAGNATNGQVSTVSGAGATWSQLAEGTGNGTYYGEIWIGKAPGVGNSQTITVTFVANTDQSMGATAFLASGVDQTTPADGAVIAASGNVVVTTATGDMAFAAHFDLTDERTLSGCTSTRDITGFGLVGYGGAHCTGSSSVTFTWSGPGSQAVRMGCNLNAAAGGGGGAIVPRNPIQNFQHLLVR